MKNWYEEFNIKDPYYSDDAVCQLHGDALKAVSELPDGSIDLIVTDPPYGISFMGKDWDKALPSKQVWAECLRVLKPGAFAFVMSIPRADCLSRMIISLEDAGFMVNFTPIYWTYASGFPKASSISKMVDKRLGAERTEKVWVDRYHDGGSRRELGDEHMVKSVDFGCSANTNYVSLPTTPQAKALEGSYGGFQPKPAVEVIIVAMKPLSEKTFVDQALKNGKGVTWLDSVRIPYESEDLDRSEVKRNSFRTADMKPTNSSFQALGDMREGYSANIQPSGRFPANLICEDDVLNDGTNYKKGGSIRSAGKRNNQVYGEDKRPRGDWDSYGDSGSFSRYFSLNAWWEERIKLLPESVQKTFPFLIVSKASKSEKNKGCEGLEARQPNWLQDDGRKEPRPLSDPRMDRPQQRLPTKNTHPCCKPLKLMSYLITLGSREGDVVLDPYSGSGTTLLACQLMGRKAIGIELDESYCEIAANRCRQSVMKLKL